MNKKLEEENRKIMDVAGVDPRFADLRTFQEEIANQYRLEKKVNTIDDEADFAAFSAQKFEELSPEQKINIQSQSMELESMVSPFRKNLELTQSQLKDYLNSSIKATEDVN